VSGPKMKGAFMPENDDVTLERASRIAYLVSVGIHSRVIQSAINRSTSAYDLGQILGFIEDLLDMGCTIDDPQE
jgi:hypothetical protein